MKATENQIYANSVSAKEFLEIADQHLSGLDATKNNPELLLETLSNIVEHPSQVTRLDNNILDSVKLTHLPGSNWIIDVDAILLVAVATILDAQLTSGTANAALALSGQTLKAATRLSQNDGSLCIFTTINQTSEVPKDSSTGLDVFHKFLHGSACKNPKFNCCHRIEDVCDLEYGAMKNGTELLAEKSLIQFDPKLETVVLVKSIFETITHR